MANSIKEELLQEGIILIHSQLGQDPNNLASIILSLTELSSSSPTTPIQLFITSSMNDQLSMMAIYDTLMSIPNPLIGFGIGHLDNYGTLLLSACDKGKRFALKHSVFHLSEPSGFLAPGQNQETMVSLEYKEISKQRELFESLLSSHSGRPISEIHEDISHNLSYSAEDALNKGIIDEILSFKEAN